MGRHIILRFVQQKMERKILVLGSMSGCHHSYIVPVQWYIANSPSMSNQVKVAIGAGKCIQPEPCWHYTNVN